MWMSLNFLITFYWFTSIIFTVLSADAVARYYPSGENETLSTQSMKYRIRNGIIK